MSWRQWIRSSWNMWHRLLGNSLQWLPTWFFPCCTQLQRMPSSCMEHHYLLCTHHSRHSSHRFPCKVDSWWNRHRETFISSLSQDIPESLLDSSCSGTDWLQVASSNLISFSIAAGCSWWTFLSSIRGLHYDELVWNWWRHRTPTQTELRAPHFVHYHAFPYLCIQSWILGILWQMCKSTCLRKKWQSNCHIYYRSFLVLPNNCLDHR